MSQISTSLMRLVLLVMVFQFSSAPFVVESWDTPDNDVCYDVQHDSVQLPIFLKEQEEKEKDKSIFVSVFVPLLDISNHNACLKASRIWEIEIIAVHEHTPRFMRFHSLQI